MKRIIHQLFFSPTGGTQKVVQEVVTHLSGDIRCYDLLREPLSNTLSLKEGDVLVVGMPVFAGRLPVVCAQMLAKIKGNGCRAIAMVVYGNREYEDALLELNELLENSGCRVVAGAAFIAQHSIFTAVAANRPDQADRAQLRVFASKCEKLLSQEPPEPFKLAIPGKKPYRALSKVPLKPRSRKSCIGCGLSSQRRCSRCGKCVSLCPVGAIPEAAPYQTDKKRCISCMACIHHCPKRARALASPLYWVAKRGFEKRNAARKEPEIFFPEGEVLE